jgi:hypothetical protein
MADGGTSTNAVQILVPAVGPTIVQRLGAMLSSPVVDWSSATCQNACVPDSPHWDGKGGSGWRFGRTLCSAPLIGGRGLASNGWGWTVSKQRHLVPGNAERKRMRKSGLGMFRIQETCSSGGFFIVGSVSGLQGLWLAGPCKIEAPVAQKRCRSRSRPFSYRLAHWRPAHAGFLSFDQSGHAAALHVRYSAKR